ncbi:MAG: THUMP domain-containing protein [Candidatus Bathyarchaeota archaeon]|nr:THUMP domain-containing protein [Candidatus Termiticorpusculum sp.]MCL2868991.1 THUMP domain-containing protein [Candidatus Termiticorpusculum sp.]
MLKDFNLIATTVRGNERAMVNEMLFLLKDHLGDQEAAAVKTGVRGIIVARTSLDPYGVVEKFHSLLSDKPYEFRFALRIIPIERVVPTDLETIKKVALELALRIGVDETYRITVEKRYTTLHSMDIISAVAAEIQNKADMENPDRILLVEIMGAMTGISLVKPKEIISVMKEKMI